MQLSDIRKSFEDLLAHQTAVQIKLRHRKNSQNSPHNISLGWNDIHYGISMLDAVIEEAIEAKRYLPIRKWWSNPEKLSVNYHEMTSNTLARQEFIEELADIFIQWLNVLVYFSVSPKEFVDILYRKLEKNNPANPDSDLGNRS